MRSFKPLELQTFTQFEYQGKQAEHKEEEKYFQIHCTQLQ